MRGHAEGKAAANFCYASGTSRNYRRQSAHFKEKGRKKKKRPLLTTFSLSRAARHAFFVYLFSLKCGGCFTLPLFFIEVVRLFHLTVRSGFAVYYFHRGPSGGNTFLRDVAVYMSRPCVKHRKRLCPKDAFKRSVKHQLEIGWPAGFQLYFTHVLI